MCGNYNAISIDDNLKPDKQPAKDAIELGNSWISDGDSDPGSVQHSFLISTPEMNCNSWKPQLLPQQVFTNEWLQNIH